MSFRGKSVAALIVAAGRGQRAGGPLAKQWQMLAGRRVIDWTIDAFSSHPAIDRILVVARPEDHPRLAAVEVVAGAETRAGSVRAGLKALAGDPPDLVLIHDAARPCLNARLIDAVLEALEKATGAAPGLAVTDSLWRVGPDGRVLDLADRDGMRRAQTPQGFHFGPILAAHDVAPEGATDDVAVALAAGLDVACVPGDEANIKITLPGDFARAARIIGGDRTMRIGNGYDVHRFGPGDGVTLCGIRLPHDRALQGHSDADVGMHALTDAIYGAMAQGDIGRHFPPSDPQWKGADSAVFLRHASGLMTEHGYRLANADVTLVCERPKIGPHAAAMAERLAQIIGCTAAQISVKATTSERLGFTGREEGIAALAAALLVPA